MHSNNIRIVQKIDFDILSVALRTDGIIYVKVKPDEEVDVVHVKQVVNAMEIIGNGKKFPILLVVGENTLPTREARDYVAEPNSNPYSMASAYVIQSFSQKLIGNVYLTFNKPPKPTRLFNSEENALEWLITFL